MISESPLGGDVHVTSVIVTTEYQGLNRSGGIGTVVAEQRACLGLDQTLVLLVTPSDIDDESAKACSVLHVNQFITADERISLPLEDQALRFLLAVLRLYPDVKTIHVQDYSGIGCRIVQARRVGLLPDSVSTVVHCHGATVYLEHGLQRWFGSSHFGIAEAEKIAIEQADLTVFPSRFLKELYCRAGIIPQKERTVIVPYPYSFSVGPHPAAANIDTLVFIGKRTSMKGFPLFLDTLDGERTLALTSTGISRVIIVGPKDSTCPNYDPTLRRLRDAFDVVETGSLSHFEMMSLLRENAPRALCVLPYFADNYPLTVLDVIECGGLPVLAKAGGLPEMVGLGQDAVLAETRPAAFCERILSLAALSPGSREALRADLLNEHLSRQTSIAEAYRTMGKLEAHPTEPDPDATVIVPFYETPLQYIRELVHGLNVQEVAPTDVIFVDDASNSEAVSELSRFLETNLRWPWRIISKLNNEGLAAARQTGFLAAKSSIVINVDSDDVPLSNFVADIVRGFARNPDVAAVVPYLDMFEDGQSSSALYQRSIGVYRPLGEGVIASQVNNQLGHANSGFNRQLVLESGGWDGANRAMWEDYALFMNLVSGGAHLAVVPRVGCLYRVRVDSMARTYPKWPAHERLACRMQGLSRFESLRLQAFSRDRVTRVEELEDALGRQAEETRRVLQEWELKRVQVEELEDALGRQAEETRRVLQEWELKRARVEELEDAFGTQAEETRRVLQEWELKRARVEELEDAFGTQAEETRRVLQEWELQSAESHRLLYEYALMKTRAEEVEQVLSEMMNRVTSPAARVDMSVSAYKMGASKPWRTLARTARRMLRGLGK